MKPSPPQQHIFRCIAAVALLVVVVLRQGGATVRFAPDPGIQFLDEALTRPLWNVFNGNDGYIQFFPRVIAYPIALLPFENLAIVCGVICAVLWGIGCLGVGVSVSDVTKSRGLGYLSAGWLAANPGASESMLANLFSIRWFGLTVLAVLLLSPSLIERHGAAVAMLVVVVGLSHAYIGVLAVMVGYWNRKQLSQHSQMRLVVGAASVVTITQFWTFLAGSSGLQKYGSDTVYAPWQGMGVFWLSVVVGPPLIGGLALAVAWPNRSTARSTFAIRLATTGLVIWCVAYAQLGIKDSPSVFTLGVTPIALAVALADREGWTTRQRSMVGAVLAVPLLVLAVKYFPASWFITSGDPWESEVARVQPTCQRSPESVVTIRQFTAKFDVPCRWIR
ncbi:MAG: hypothetical protein ACKORC_06130 [Acidimicrobiia bacterium]